MVMQNGRQTFLVGRCWKHCQTFGAHGVMVNAQVVQGVMGGSLEDYRLLTRSVAFEDGDSDPKAWVQRECRAFSLLLWAPASIAAESIQASNLHSHQTDLVLVQKVRDERSRAVHGALQLRTVEKGAVSVQASCGVEGVSAHVGAGVLCAVDGLSSACAVQLQEWCGKEGSCVLVGPRCGSSVPYAKRIPWCDGVSSEDCIRVTCRLFVGLVFRWFQWPSLFGCSQAFCSVMTTSPPSPPFLFTIGSYRIC